MKKNIYKSTQQLFFSALLLLGNVLPADLPVDEDEALVLPVALLVFPLLFLSLFTGVRLLICRTKSKKI